MVRNPDHGKKNAAITYHVAVPFILSDAGFTAGDAAECDNTNLEFLVAKALAKRQGHIGALAFGRTTDTEAGHFFDVVLKKYGKVPSDTTML